MTRLELAYLLIEIQAAYPVCLHPRRLSLMRVERFELITVLILSQPPLPVGLHARKFLRILAAGFEPASNEVLSFVCLPVSSREPNLVPMERFELSTSCF